MQIILHRFLDGPSHTNNYNRFYTISGFCEQNFEFRNRFKLCYTIPVDSQIKSMFRLDAKTIDCPLTIKGKPPNNGERHANTAFQLTYR